MNLPPNLRLASDTLCKTDRALVLTMLGQGARDVMALAMLRRGGEWLMIAPKSLHADWLRLWRKYAADIECHNATITMVTPEFVRLRRNEYVGGLSPWVQLAFELPPVARMSRTIYKKMMARARVVWVRPRDPIYMYQVQVRHGFYEPRPVPYPVVALPNEGRDFNIVPVMCQGDPSIAVPPMIRQWRDSTMPWKWPMGARP
jgi:hypothetical protein